MVEDKMAIPYHHESFRRAEFDAQGFGILKMKVLEIIFKVNDHDKEITKIKDQIHSIKQDVSIINAKISLITDLLKKD